MEVKLPTEGTRYVQALLLTATAYLQYSRHDQTLTFLYLASCAVSVRACCKQSKTHLKTRTKLSEALHIYSTQYKHILLTFADP